MDYFHHKLIESSSFYRKWHEDKDYHIKNWAIFLAVVVVALVSLTTAINRYVSVELSESRAATGITYYVSTDGNDANPGTQTQPWRTIQKAANTMVAGDTASVQAGTYDERVTIARSGSAGSPITFQANGNSKVKGFSMINQGYIKLQGFEITHSGLTAEPYAGSTGVASVLLKAANNIHVLNNYIHDTEGTCVLFYDNGPVTASNHVLVKDNTIAHCGALAPSQLTGIAIFGDYNLAEGNDITNEGGDFMRMLGGSFNVIRNNKLHDNVNPDTTYHIDGVQNWCTTGSLAMRHLLIENNTLYNAPDYNSHFVIFQDPGECGNSDVIIRHNTVQKLGSYFLVTGLTYTGGKNIRIYNNDAIDLLVAQNSKGWYVIGYGANSTGGKVINNLFYNTVRDGGYVYYFDSTSQAGFDAHNNLAYNSGYSGSWLPPIRDEANVVLNQDPLFLSSSDFHLQSTSPAIDRGGYLTKVSATDTGSGTQLVVDDAGFFQDGWAGVVPDWIAVGKTGNVAQIASIDYVNNAIILTAPLSRLPGDSVWLFKDSSGRQVLSGSAPDIGAYEYASGSTTPPPPPPSPTPTSTTVIDTTPPSVSITAPINGGTVTRNTSLTIQASASDDTGVSKVDFFINGTLKCSDTTSPYTCSWKVPGKVGRTYRLQAQATDTSGNIGTSSIITVTAK